MNSSTRTVSPASPNAPSLEHRRGGRVRVVDRLADDHAFSRGEPRRLDDDRRAELVDRARARRRASSQVSARAVGTPASAMSVFENAFDVSSIARGARRVRRSAARRRETRRRCPAASGASGPTSVQSTRCCRANATSASMSVAPIGNARRQLGDARIAWAPREFDIDGSSCRRRQASACSRPPPPTSKHLHRLRHAELTASLRAAEARP